MNSGDNNAASKRRCISRNSAASAAPASPSKQIDFSLDIVLCMASFMCFQDYRNFILALCPNYLESDIICRTLWKLSTYRTETIFINGKPIIIEYNFDPSRLEEDRILMSVESLSPIFGEIVSPILEKFTGVSKLTNFVKMHTHLNHCSEGRFATCPCHLVEKKDRRFETFQKPVTDACPYGHYHHYCAHHIAGWLKVVENNLILLRQQGHHFSEDLARSFILSMDKSIYAHGVEMQLYGSIIYGPFTRWSCSVHLLFCLYGICKFYGDKNSKNSLIMLPLCILI